MKQQQIPRSWGLFGLVLIASFVVGGCSPQEAMPESPKLKSYDGVETVTKSDENVTFNPKVDILFVIDDSGSMNAYQENLRANIPNFIAEIEKSSILDYHIGVTSSSYDDYAPPTSDCGGARDACGWGWLHGGNAKVPYIDRNTPNGLSVLADNMVLGIGGSATEKFFKPTLAALSAPLINDQNAGFYRTNATLVVIFITDTDDQSENMTADSYLQNIWALKKGDKRKVLNYGVIIPVGTASRSGCSRDVYQPVKLTEVIAKTNGTFFDLCDSDYGTELGIMAADLAQKVGRVLYLNRKPAVNSISVNFGTQKIENDLNTGWTYDSSRNAIVFGEQLVLSEQPEGTTMSIKFNAASN